MTTLKPLTKGDINGFEFYEAVTLTIGEARAVARVFLRSMGGAALWQFDIDPVTDGGYRLQIYAQGESKPGAGSWCPPLIGSRAET